MLLTVPAASCPARQIGKLRQTWQAPGNKRSLGVQNSKGIPEVPEGFQNRTGFFGSLMQEEFFKGS